MVLETTRFPPVQRYEILSSLLSLILNFTQFNNSFWETFQQNCFILILLLNSSQMLKDVPGLTSSALVIKEKKP